MQPFRERLHDRAVQFAADSLEARLDVAASRLIPKGLLSRFRRDESGGYLIMTGMVMAALAGVVGLGTEAGVWLLKHRKMQNAADSAAVSAATAYYVQGNASGLALQAEAVAAGYGFVNGTANTTVTTNQPPASGPHVNPPRAVEVLVAIAATTYVLVNTFRPALMGEIVFRGINLAVASGMALIVGALVLALLYAALCRLSIGGRA